jgi:hypothetical protein
MMIGAVVRRGSPTFLIREPAISHHHHHHRVSKNKNKNRNRDRHQGRRKGGLAGSK